MISGTAFSKVLEMRINHDEAGAGTAAGFNRDGDEVGCKMKGSGEAGALNNGVRGQSVAAAAGGANCV